MKYNLKSLMLKAWSLYRKALKKGINDFSAALKLAWKWLKVQATNALRIEAAAEAAGYGEEVVRTWYGWKAVGREVMHTEVAAFQVEVEDPTTKKGTRVESFFTYEQTFQPIEG